MSYLVKNLADIQPGEVKSILNRHLIGDRMDMVMDLERSEGAYVYDSLHNRRLLDFFSCFATVPVGYNHPKMTGDEDFKRDLLRAALINPSNSDVSTVEKARFMQVFERVGIPEYLPHAFFIAGGALAVENALKVAMDWKVQKNFQKGYTYEKGTKIIHFQEAFHGRSGYTLTMTNTDPIKVKYFAKFADWPRVLNPKIVFPLTEEGLEDLERREELSLAQIKTAFHEHRDDIAAVIVEPIQCEGGDHHMRADFFRRVRELCLENDALLIYDEVQVGCGATGTFWCHEQFGPECRPDLLAFGKKMQVCGILGGPRIDEVEHNCFTVSSRINSTWGGNLVDMVRAARILQIIEEDNVLENVREGGEFILAELYKLAQEHPKMTNVRGRGLIVAFDLPNAQLRNEFIARGMHYDVLFLGCGERSIRLRPTLTITRDELAKGVEIIGRCLRDLHL
ncbi:MAG: L-lysine 6-transaminase [Bacteroidia bacterium]|nr:L-lysine 6-transaminase [Bacteroidia bacterium]